MLVLSLAIFMGCIMAFNVMCCRKGKPKVDNQNTVVAEENDEENEQPLPTKPRSDSTVSQANPLYMTAVFNRQDQLSVISERNPYSEIDISSGRPSCSGGVGGRGLSVLYLHTTVSDSPEASSSEPEYQSVWKGRPTGLPQDRKSQRQTPTISPYANVALYT